MLFRSNKVLTLTKERKGFPGGSDGKVSVYNVGDPGSIPGSGRSPGEGNGNPLQYSCLENSMDGGAWWATVHRVAKSWTQLSDFTFTFFFNGLAAAATMARRVKKICLPCRRHKRCSFYPSVGKIPWRRRGNPFQYSCLENPHGQRSLVGYSPQGRKELDTTERLNFH